MIYPIMTLKEAKTLKSYAAVDVCRWTIDEEPDALQDAQERLAYWTKVVDDEEKQ